jgi:hypothetical protein
MQMAPISDLKPIDKGTRNRSMTTQEMAAIRRQEQLNAAAGNGYASYDLFYHL